MKIVFLVDLPFATFGEAREFIEHQRRMKYQGKLFIRKEKAAHFKTLFFVVRPFDPKQDECLIESKAAKPFVKKVSRWTLQEIG